MKSNLGAFTKTDFTHLYNCSLKLPAPYDEFLEKFHFHLVNPSALKVKPEIFGHVAPMPDRMPWVKVALLAANYMCKAEYVL